MEKSDTNICETPENQGLENDVLFGKLKSLLKFYKMQIVIMKAVTEKESEV